MRMAIGERLIGENEPPLVIAEAGVNHNGDPALSLALVDAAADAGADAVKFQTFSANALAVADAPQAAYQRERAGAASQRAMLAALELPRSALEEASAHARERGLIFLSTPFDVESLELLVELGVPAIKIGSGDLTNLILVRAAAATGLPLLLSTGMANLEEIGAILDDIGDAEIALLQCTSAYPAPIEDANLRAIATLRDAFGRPVGYSDHTQGFTAAIAAVALGASIIEKHFTLDRSMDGPDHEVSLEPAELAAMVRSARDAHVALGDGAKAARPVEADARRVVRRSLVAARALPAGHRLAEADLAAKRPATGISPLQLDRVVGTVLRRAVVVDQVLTDDDVDLVSS